MGVKDTYIHEECMKELDTMFKKKTSFGEYFDNQHDAIVKAMQNKNKQLNVEWMEAYEKREQLKDYNHRMSIQNPVDTHKI